MRPPGEVRDALLASAMALTTIARSPTLRELLNHSQVGRLAGRRTVDHMRRAGQLAIVRTRVVGYRNRPVAEYCPPAELVDVDGDRCVLRDVLASWSTPIT